MCSLRYGSFARRHRPPKAAKALLHLAAGAFTIAGAPRIRGSRSSPQNNQIAEITRAYPFTIDKSTPGDSEPFMYERSIPCSTGS